MVQRWHDVLFAHWPVDPAPLRALLPTGLALDLFDGAAWLGVVPFRMTGVRVARLPPVPGTHAFPELNVRTYVRHGERAGVWFLSLDATSRIAVAAARRWFHLPYYRARITCEDDGTADGVRDGSAGGRADTGIRYRCRRTHKGAPAAEFVGRYRPTGPVVPSVPGSLDSFLTERYSLFAANNAGDVLRGDVEHVPWPLQPAEAEIEVNTMAAAAGIGLPEAPPLLHFSRRLDVDILAPRRV